MIMAAKDEKRNQQERVPKKQRLDMLLVERELVESREQAKRLIMAGEVLVGTERIDKAGHMTAIDADITVRNQPRFVSRGGLKLSAALERFQIDVQNLTAIDVGASTGGFTDCLLQNGIRHVFAIDVGYGQLAWKIRNDARVTSIERTNIRYFHALPGGELADLAVIDASFISLQLVLPPSVRLLKAQAQIVALIKPQFEAGADRIGKGGVVRDTAVHQEVLSEVLNFVTSKNLQMLGLMASPAPGPAGNIEFLLWLEKNESLQSLPQNKTDTTNWQQKLIDAALLEASLLRKGAE